MKSTSKIISKLAVIAALIFTTACNRENINTNYTFSFYPRVAEYVYTTPAHIITNTYQDKIHYEYKELEKDKPVKITDFLLAVSTYNFDLELVRRGELSFMDSKFKIDERDEQLENMLETNYIQAGRKKIVALSTESPIQIEYRITGVKKLTVKALDTPLFGKPTNSYLNDFLRIVKYQPDFIASYTTRNLLYGFSDSNKPGDIEEWLSLMPLANETMYLGFSEPVQENLPLSTRFVVEMETDDGVLLSDTTDMITLTK